MEDFKFKQKVMYKLGAIEKQLETLNGATAKNTDKTAKHDVILGKIGVIIVGATFILSTIIAFIVDWIKSKF